MRSKFEYLKKHLETQIKRADQLGSDWVYITKTEAEKCLELAEAEETLLDILEGKQNG